MNYRKYMTLSILVLSLVTFRAQGAAPASSAGFSMNQEKINEAWQGLVEVYNPTKENCRVWGEAGKENVKKIAGLEVEMTIVCMVAGFKNVYFGEAGDLEEMDNFDDEVRLVYRAHNLDRLIFKAPDGLERFVMFTPQGRTNALLLMQFGTDNDYLMGHLLGYPDEAIKHYYAANHAGRADTDYEAEKKEAHQWIEEDKPIIEQWLADQMRSGQVYRRPV
ncbi:MAG: hypothetical protein P4L31_01025 [Candidatus Babeliales bacterium]|nr:hypothetical protein [Candidatus Babeliales bacterium]